MTLRPLSLWIVVPLALSTACGGNKAPADPGGDGPDPAGCEDLDGDGFGRGAACAGTDCDESDASVHAGCVDTCSSCQDTCMGWDGCAPLDPADGSGLANADGGGLTVAGDEGGGGPSLSVIWIANSAQGTVSKVDTRTRVELGRYYTGVDHMGDNPSRTSVDERGDVIVANRAFGMQASVTKILAGDCPDRNGNGSIDTSSGRDDVLAWNVAGSPTDECIAWRAEVGCADNGFGGGADGGAGGQGEGGWMGCGVARSVAVENRMGLDGLNAEVVWVGLFNEQKYVELDRTTGAPTGVEVSVAPCTPYGAAIDRDGRLWSACLSNNLASFDTAHPEMAAEVLQQPGSNYGITVDEHGHVWTGGSVTRYDPQTRTFRQPGVDGEAEPCEPNQPDGRNGECWNDGQAYGSAIAADGQGSIWVGGCGGGVCRVREEGDDLTLTSLNVGNGAYGMAVDFDGMVWGIGMGGNNAAVIDPDTEAFELVLNDCEGGGGGGFGDAGNGQDGPGGEGMGGTGCLSMPYTYSDMTGFQLANAQDPRGTLPLLFEGCAAGPTAWLVVVAEAEIPVGSAISIEARAADSREALSGVPFTPVGALTDGETELDLSALTGGHLELRITLRGHGGAFPTLRGLRTAWSCEEIFG